MSAYLMGIDCGGTAAKVALFDAEGRMLGSFGERIPMAAPRPGHAERDAQAMWTAAARAIRRLLERTGVPASAIVGIGATGHGVGVYLVGADGTPVRAAINSTDTRAAELVATTVASGIQTQVRRKSLQDLWPGQPEMLLAWLRRLEPAALKQAARLLFCKDFIRLRLTGRPSLEHTDLATTNLYDVRAARLDPELLALFGLEDLAGLFGEVMTSESLAGAVTAEAAAATGLVQGTPVVAGCIDVVASALGAGCVDPGAMAIIAGTWSINEQVTTAPVESDGLFMLGRFVGADRFLAIEASACSAGNLEWFLDHVLGGEVDRGEVDRGALYATCNALVAGVSPDDAPVLFLPYLNGSRDTGFARGTLVGLTGFHTKAHLLRAVYEGVAFEHRAHIERLLMHGPKPPAARLTGGAARSPVWAQMFADVCLLPVEVPECAETGALGAAMCAAVGVGLHRDYAAAASAMVRVAARHAPDPARAAIYDERYRRHRALAAALAPFWAAA